MDDEVGTMIVAGILIIIAVAIFIGGCFGVGYLYREYDVWSSSMAGKAELAKAEFSRKIAVTEAEAKAAAAESLAKADVIRAEGIAKANKIIGQSLTQNEKYLEWKFIDELPQQQNQIIYLPTDSFLPVLEAGRGSKVKAVGGE